ncbi:MAG: diaminopimelate epimerase [Planctomycetaceae bacterium]
MNFIKMHGAGNDYVYIDCFQQEVFGDIPALARNMSDRHTGIGADGLILIEPSLVADARMRMWNADGSPGEMCGNGIRCVARYLFENHDMSDINRTEFSIETAVGIKQLHVNQSHGEFQSARVDMGEPIFDAKRIPTTLHGNPPTNEEIRLSGVETSPSSKELEKLVNVTAVSMGNPHCVVFLDEISDDHVRHWGPLLEHHSAFPKRTNVEFVRVVSDDQLEIRVWERGSGETLACGTGACAAVVAAVLTEQTGQSVACHMRGGILHVEWEETGTVLLTGPAEEVFRGEWRPSRENGEIGRGTEAENW